MKLFRQKPRLKIEVEFTREHAAMLRITHLKSGRVERICMTTMESADEYGDHDTLTIFTMKGEK